MRSWMLLALVAACGGGGDGGDDGGEPAGPVLTRAVPEPPGAACPEGGTRVVSGVDANGDGSLGDDEITASEVVCNGAVVTRVVVDAPGSPCVGGVAIESGRDTDGDGVLDDAEVLTTEYVCDDVAFGEVELVTAADVARYAKVRVIVGNLWVDDSELADLELPALRFVTGGVLVINNELLVAARFPALTDVAGGLGITSNDLLTTVETPVLLNLAELFVAANDVLPAIDAADKRIDGDVIIRDNPALVAIDWSTGVTGWIRGRLEISDNNALLSVAIRSSSFLQGDVLIDLNRALTQLELRAPSVTGRVRISRNFKLASLAQFIPTVGGDYQLVDNPLLAQVTADFVGISSAPGVGGNLTITGAPIATLAFGTTATGLRVAGNATLAGLRVAALRHDTHGLERVDGALTVSDNPLLADVRVRGGAAVAIRTNPALQTATVTYEPAFRFAQSFEVSGNPQLTALTASNLVGVSSSVILAGNSALTSTGLPALQSANSLVITNNAALPVCRITALFAQVAASTETQSGNDDDGVCN